MSLPVSWSLARPGRDLPSATERLDQGLEAVKEYIPERFHGCLLFGDSAIGLEKRLRHGAKYAIEVRRNTE